MPFYNVATVHGDEPLDEGEQNMSLNEVFDDSDQSDELDM